MPPGTRWWQTTPARIGCMLAVPLLGLISEFLGFLMLIAAIVLIWKGNPWQKGVKVAATIGAMALLGSVVPEQPENTPSSTVAEADGKSTGSGLTTGHSASASASQEPDPAPKALDYRGMRLDKAREKAEDAGFGFGDHDASDQDKGIWMRSNWTVCFQETGRTSAGAKTIDFGAVQTDSPCPERDGGAIPWPTMPDLVWKTWKAAHKEVVGLGVPADRVRAEAAYLNDQLPDDGEYDDWRVCAHDPAEGEDVTNGTWVTLELTDPANGCPEPDGEGGDGVRLPDRDNDGDPDYRDPFPGDKNRNSAFPDGYPDSSGGSDSSSGGSSGGSGGAWCPTRWC
jgi:hypothetical protein